MPKRKPTSEFKNQLIDCGILITIDGYEIVDEEIFHENISYVVYLLFSNYSPNFAFSTQSMNIEAKDFIINYQDEEEELSGLNFIQLYEIYTHPKLAWIEEHINTVDWDDGKVLLKMHGNHILIRNFLKEIGLSTFRIFQHGKEVLAEEEIDKQIKFSKRCSVRTIPARK